MRQTQVNLYVQNPQDHHKFSLYTMTIEPLNYNIITGDIVFVVLCHVTNGKIRNGQMKQLFKCNMSNIVQ